MRPQIIELLDRRLSRLRDEHGNELPFQANEALAAVDVGRKLTILEAYEKMLRCTALGLSEYCEKVRMEVSQLADETIIEFSTEDRDIILEVVTGKFDPALYLSRFDLFGEAVSRHFSRACMNIRPELIRTDLLRARQHAGSSNMISRFLASLKDDLDLLIERKKQVAGERSKIANSVRPHWTIEWGFCLAFVATVATIAGTYRAFVPAATFPVGANPLKQQALDLGPPTSTPGAAALATSQPSRIASAPR